MNEIERIEKQLKLAFEGGAWHGPGVLETLEGVTARQAAAHPVPGAHSIWELVVHIAAWENACRRRLEGDRAELSTEENWPPIADTGETAWAITKAALIESHHKLRESIAILTDTRLDEPILQDMPSVYITIHGVIQHDLYHSGQMAILKKSSFRGGDDMNELAGRECVPCRGGVPPLKGEEIKKLLSQLDGWEVVNEHHLSKVYKFNDFREAQAFVDLVGNLAEEQSHHPDICFGWGRAEITIWTHKIAGLTESDFILAAKIDEI